MYHTVLAFIVHSYWFLLSHIMHAYDYRVIGMGIRICILSGLSFRNMGWICKKVIM